MLELECFFAVGAFEFAKASALVVTDHVTLQTVDVCEILLAHGTRLRVRLKGIKKRKSLRD